MIWHNYSNSYLSTFKFGFFLVTLFAIIRMSISIFRKINKIKHFNSIISRKCSRFKVVAFNFFYRIIEGTHFYDFTLDERIWFRQTICKMHLYLFEQMELSEWMEWIYQRIERAKYARENNVILKSLTTHV